MAKKKEEGPPLTYGLWVNPHIFDAFMGRLSFESLCWTEKEINIKGIIGIQVVHQDDIGNLNDVNDLIPLAGVVQYAYRRFKGMSSSMS